jgi:hypothetical protein
LSLRGKIISTKYNGKILSYGLSIEGPLLWFIGFPSTYVENELALQLELVDMKTNSILWQQSFKKEDSALSFLYVSQPDFMYDTLLKDIMKEVIPSIKNKISQNTGIIINH